MEWRWRTNGKEFLHENEMCEIVSSITRCDCELCAKMKIEVA